MTWILRRIKLCMSRRARSFKKDNKAGRLLRLGKVTSNLRLGPTTTIETKTWRSLCTYRKETTVSTTQSPTSRTRGTLLEKDLSRSRSQAEPLLRIRRNLGT
jgi:hypothetical protein